MTKLEIKRLKIGERISFNCACCPKRWEKVLVTSINKLDENFSVGTKRGASQFDFSQINHITFKPIEEDDTGMDFL